jgi:hypothetical protein
MNAGACIASGEQHVGIDSFGHLTVFSHWLSRLFGCTNVDDTTTKDGSFQRETAIERGSSH